METVDEHMMHTGGGLELQGESVEYLRETRKWAKFLAIMGFLFIGLMVLAGIGMSATLNQLDTAGIDTAMPFPMGWLGFVYILMAAIYFFPVLYLYRFSDRMKAALDANDTLELNNAFRHLKSHYRFIGIATIIVIVMYIIGILVFVGLGVSSFAG